MKVVVLQKKKKTKKVKSKKIKNKNKPTFK